MERYGVDRLYLDGFYQFMAQQSPQDFVENYIEALKAKVVVAGFDFILAITEQM